MLFHTTDKTRKRRKFMFSMLLRIRLEQGRFLRSKASSKISFKSHCHDRSLWFDVSVTHRGVSSKRAIKKWGADITTVPQCCTTQCTAYRRLCLFRIHCCCGRPKNRIYSMPSISNVVTFLLIFLGISGQCNIVFCFLQCCYCRSESRVHAFDALWNLRLSWS